MAQSTEPQPYGKRALRLLRTHSVGSSDTVTSVAKGLSSRLRQEGPAVLSEPAVRKGLKMKEWKSGKSVAHEMVIMGDKSAAFWFCHDPSILRIQDYAGRTVRDFIGPSANGAKYTGRSWIPHPD